MCVSVADVVIACVGVHIGVVDFIINDGDRDRVRCGVRVSLVLVPVSVAVSVLLLVSFLDLALHTGWADLSQSRKDDRH